MPPMSIPSWSCEVSQGISAEEMTARHAYAQTGSYMGIPMPMKADTGAEVARTASAAKVGLIMSSLNNGFSIGKTSNDSG